MVVQKGRPSLCWFGIPRRPSHPPQYGSLRNIETEHFQLSMNARRAPRRVFATMRKMSSRNSLLTHFLPTCALRREIQAQYSLKPARCQRTTVSGWTRINARFHPGQSRRNITQKNLSGAANCGRGCLCLRTPSWCRSARFSKSKSRRERKTRANRRGRRPRRRTIKPVLHGFKAH